MFDLIREITISPGMQGPGLDLSQFTNGEIECEGEGGLPIRRYTFHQYTIYSFDDKAYVIGVEDNHQLTIARSYTLPDFRQQGLATALYSGLLENGITLQSDSQLSEETYRIWRTIALRYRVFARNVVNGNGGDIAKDGSDWHKAMDSKGNVRLVAVKESDSSILGKVLSEHVVHLTPLTYYTNPTISFLFE